MVQTKSYLKYSAAGKCNIIASVDANLSLNSNRGSCFAAAVEDVCEYNKKTGELVITCYRLMFLLSTICHCRLIHSMVISK